MNMNAIGIILVCHPDLDLDAGAEPVNKHFKQQKMKLYGKSGCFLQVFKAVQDDVRIVAVKLSHNDAASGVASTNAFWREIETIADLRDRNVGSA